MKIEVMETKDGDAQWCSGCFKDFQGTMLRIGHDTGSLATFHLCPDCMSKLALTINESGATAHEVKRNWVSA